jgi:hypothetical protein
VAQIFLILTQLNFEGYVKASTITKTITKAITSTNSVDEIVAVANNCVGTTNQRRDGVKSGVGRR